jgi:serine/threonine protein kinase
MLSAKLGERYKIVSELGQGGMATVYRGLDTVLGREVAIKVLHDHLASDTELCIRFQQEASIAAKLDHPNIVKIYDYGQDDKGRGFIISELIKGQNLHKLQVSRLKAGRGLFPVVVSAMLVEEVLKGLCHAHEMNVIHRDVKPDNVMISRRGHVKLADFGIAKNISSTLTMAGKYLGSPSYSSPEQIRGLDLDFRTDLFSAGIILYECLTDRLPFRGRSATDVMVKISKGDHDPLEKVAPHLPKELMELVATALATEASGRFASTSAMIQKLRRFLDDAGVPDSRAGLEAYARNPDEFVAHLQPSTRSTLKTTLTTDESTPTAFTNPRISATQARSAEGLYTLNFRSHRAPQSRPMGRLGTSERKSTTIARRTTLSELSRIPREQTIIATDAGTKILDIGQMTEPPPVVPQQRRRRRPALVRHHTRVQRPVRDRFQSEQRPSFAQVALVLFVGATLLALAVPRTSKQVSPSTNPDTTMATKSPATPQPPINKRQQPSQRPVAIKPPPTPRPLPSAGPTAPPRATVQASPQAEPKPKARPRPQNNVDVRPRPTPQSSVQVAAKATKPLVGMVILRTVPGDLPLVVNGIAKEPSQKSTTASVYELPPGRSVLSIRPTVIGGTKYQGFEKPIFVAAGEALDLGLIRLHPIRTFKLRIQGPGILAKINGDPYALRNGALDLELPEGSIDLHVTSTSGKSLQRTIQLRGDDVTLEASLE